MYSSWFTDLESSLSGHYSMKIGLCKTRNNRIMFCYTKKQLQSSMDLHCGLKVPFYRVIISNITRHMKKKEKSVHVSSATCEPQRSVIKPRTAAIASELPTQLHRQCPHILFWRKGILHLFHALHLTIDRAIEIK